MIGVHPGRHAGRPVRARLARSVTIPGSITSPFPIPIRSSRFAEFGIILLLFSIGLGAGVQAAYGPCAALVFGRRCGRTVRSRAGAPGARRFIPDRPALPGRLGLGLALALVSSTALVIPIAGTTSAVGRAAVRNAAVRGSGARADHLRAWARWRQAAADAGVTATA